MRRARGYVAVAAIGDSMLLVAGGHNSTCRAMDAVELFDISTQTWIGVAPMSTVRTAASAVECNGTVYVLGGNDVNNSKLDVVECYDVKTNQWHKVTCVLRLSHELNISLSIMMSFSDGIDD